MRLVTQTRTGSPTGNCSEACIASLLEVEIEEVPDLLDLEHEPGDPEFRLAGWARMHAFLHARGLQFVQVSHFPAVALAMMVNRFGVRVRGMHHVAAGPNPDGLGHAVVALWGVPVWDPNPSRRGITSVEEMWFLIPLDWIEEECRTWPGIKLSPPGGCRTYADVFRWATMEIESMLSLGKVENEDDFVEAICSMAGLRIAVKQPWAQAERVAGGWPMGLTAKLTGPEVRWVMFGQVLEGVTLEDGPAAALSKWEELKKLEGGAG